MDWLDQTDVDDALVYLLPPEPRPDGLTARDSTFLIDYCIGRFLRRRPVAEGPQFVACSPDGMLWLVRWPNRRTGWESRAGLEAKGYAPDTPIVCVMDTP